MPASLGVELWQRYGGMVVLAYRRKSMTSVSGLSGGMALLKENRLCNVELRVHPWHLSLRVADTVQATSPLEPASFIIVSLWHARLAQVCLPGRGWGCCNLKVIVICVQRRPMAKKLNVAP